MWHRPETGSQRTTMQLRRTAGARRQILPCLRHPDRRGGGSNAGSRSNGYGGADAGAIARANDYATAASRHAGTGVCAVA